MNNSPEQGTDPGHGSDAQGRLRNLSAIGAIIVVPLIAYGLGLAGLAALDDRPLAETRCFDARTSAAPSTARVLGSVAMAGGASAILFATPVWLGIVALRGRGRKSETAHAWSLAFSAAAVIVVCLVLRHTAGIDRQTFLAGWLVWIGCLAFAAGWYGQAWHETSRFCRKYGKGLLLGLATIAGVVAVFWQEQFLQCFNGDGIEHFELARSLRHNFLPTWELEAAGTGEFGAVIVSPNLISSYWVLGLQLLLGEAEFASRLSFWLYCLAMIMVCYRHLSRAGQPSPAMLISLGLSVWPLAIWYTLYAGYYPYMSDFGVPDACFALLFLLAFDCLERKDCAGWVLMLVLSSLVSYGGPVMSVLSVVAAWVWKPVDRRRVFRSALAGGACLVTIAGLYLFWGWWHDLIEVWWLTLKGEYVVDYIVDSITRAPLPRVSSGFLFFGYFLLGCGGVPAFALVGAFVRSPWERTLASVTLGYLLIILFSAYKNLHYLGPLLMVPMLLWGLRRSDGRPGFLEKVPWLTPVSIGICIALCWPPARPVFTLNRELGERTTFMADSYQQACDLGRMAPYLYDSHLLGWFVGPTNWVAYAEISRQPTEARPLVVKAGPPPSADYRLLFSAREGGRVIAGLYSRDRATQDWMSRQQPAAGRERFPWVFSPIAIEPPLRPPGRPDGR